MTIEYSQRLQRIPAYPAAAAYALPDDVALLASNESPDPPLPAVAEAIERVLRGLNRYPDPSNAGLRAALSARYDVPPERIAIGNGSCDILLALGEALLEPGAELVHAWPSFSVYPHLEAAAGARAIRVPLNDRDEHDLEAMLAEVTAATRLLIVCNPNNPTSTAVPAAAIADLAARVPPHVCLLVDEAYCEFNTLDDPDETLPLLAAHPNLILLRTFSKVYGLAGLRVGFAVCGSAEPVAAVDRVRQPFFCTAPAQAGAIEALRHQDAVAERVERAVLARVEVADGLDRIGIAVAQSQANFCWLTLPAQAGEDAGALERHVVAALRERGVLVRSGAALGREGCLRVTYGTPAENARFLAAVAESLALVRA